MVLGGGRFLVSEVPRYTCALGQRGAGAARCARMEWCGVLSGAVYRKRLDVSTHPAVYIEESDESCGEIE